MDVRSHDRAGAGRPDPRDARRRSPSPRASPSATSRRRSRSTSRGYRFRQSDEPVRLAADALARSGYEPRYILTGGGADANVFNERGLQCVNLGNGMANIHSSDEHIAVADLEAMVDVTLALVDAARAA